MGYRSTVYLGIEHKIIEQLLTFCATKAETYSLLFEVSESATKTKKGGIVFQWDFIKWYDSFDAINELNTFLNDHDENIKFLRLGESIEDVSEAGFSEDFYFEVSREVTVHIEGE